MNLALDGSQVRCTPTLCCTRFTRWWFSIYLGRQLLRTMRIVYMRCLDIYKAPEAIATRSSNVLLLGNQDC
jgi:hypothetical protein